VRDEHHRRRELGLGEKLVQIGGVAACRARLVRRRRSIYQVRASGAWLLLVGIFSLAISVTTLRRGERWAWFAMWVWPLGVALVVAMLWSATRGPGEGIPVPIISGSITIVISLLTLASSARRYLRRQRLEADR
jgi:FtsH-binding integral membrane protein